jgi:hypothetical protein
LSVVVNPWTEALGVLRAPIRDADKLERLYELRDFLRLQVEIYPLDDRRRVLLARVRALIMELEGDDPSAIPGE